MMKQTFCVDVGANVSVIGPSEKHDELSDVVTVEDYEGNTRNKKLWRKKKINVIFGNYNLLCPDDLVKIGEIGIIDKDKKIIRIMSRN